MQKLTISGFLGLSHVEIEISRLTALIGEQASGKSIVARLIFFFNEYFSGFSEVPLIANEHKRTYDSNRKADFYKIFPKYTWSRDAFEICYSNDLHSVKISSSSGSDVIEISSSASVATSFRSLKALFKEFNASQPESSRFSKTRMLREFNRQKVNSDLMKYESPLFVPAARSFYSTIREEIFSILSIDEKIDKIIMQFGEFYEAAKYGVRVFDRSTPKDGSISLEEERRYFSSIVKGQFVKNDDRDFIETSRGQIEMSKASSGQQEAVPLIFAISRFPSPGRTLVIEEPEAHLFPTSQVEILSFIVSQSVKRETSILFTTHSPYLLTALNNHILLASVRPDKGIDGSMVRAYSLSDGRSSSIVDTETGLISTDYIDSVSDSVLAEFSKLLEALDEH